MIEQDKSLADKIDLLDQLSAEERLLLMKFVCSFAWADLKIKKQERALVVAMIRRLAFHETERRQIHSWLEVPPRADEVDPSRVPRQHRAIFLRAVRATVAADGEISPHERESLRLFDRLIA